jgi:predicted membrane-bound spermidine synthase
MLVVIFAVSMFVSASLLFVIEPMLAKMILPLLGGTPAVWNTCLVFFQFVLLAGYLYAFGTAKWLPRRVQIVLHCALVLGCFAVLPPRIPSGWEPPAQSSPVFPMLALLTVAVGLPFFLLSSSTPLLQRWFAESGHRSARDPYFLYAASNAGSLMGLLGYPFLLEPMLRLGQQSRLWGLGYALFALLTLCCGVLTWRTKDLVREHVVGAEKEVQEPVQWRQRIHWIALAFVPSSLMMSVTTALTTDLPAIPLMWVLPLGIYLLTFVLVFATRPLVSHSWLIRRLPFIILLALWPTVSKLNLPYSPLFVWYLFTLFAVSMVCHGQLARNRPKTSHLTEFYLLISFGGVLGGIFNALVAPIIFSSVLEFPVTLILAALLIPSLSAGSETKEIDAKKRRNDLLFPTALGLSMAAVIIAVSRFTTRLDRPVQIAIYILVFGYSMVWCLSFGKRPLRFAAGVLALTAASSLYQGPYGRLLFKQRSFFGVLRVANNPANNLRYFFHGATVHGIQSLDLSRSREPLSYYDRSGPAGSILRAMHAKTTAVKSRWAVVGLGAGALACYSQPGESLTFYEIDPGVMRIASNPRYFTFLEQCAPAAKIVLGDARLKMREAPDGSYDLIVLDAFSGDTIPMHLLTREALALYLRKLAPGGMLAFHMSNLHIRLEPSISALAKDAGMVCVIDDDTVLTRAQADQGKSASQWMVMARSPTDLGVIAADAHWKLASLPARTHVWTDDYSNLLDAIKWTGR